MYANLRTRDFIEHKHSKEKHKQLTHERPREKIAAQEPNKG